MRSFTALPSIVMLVTCASAQVVTIPMTKLQRSDPYLEGQVPDADRTRTAFLRARAYGEPVTVPATNLGFAEYAVRIGIGNPQTYYNLAIDTGSSNTVCGTGHNPYKRTSTSIATGQNVTLHYSEGYFTGFEYLDRVTLAPGLVIHNQSIAAALSYADFGPVDGIIGMGPMDLTGGTLPQNPTEMIPTIMDNLAAQGVTKQIFSIYFAPAKNDSDRNGALTYGGPNPDLYQGELVYTPLTTTYPASAYWGFNLTCTYGNRSVIPMSTAGIVDAGTSLILLADDFVDSYIQAIPGASFDQSRGVVSIPASSVPLMHPLTFMIGDMPLELDVAAQLTPETEDSGGEQRYGVVSKAGSPSGQGNDFTLGQKFLERFYSVYDADAKRIGFAKTNHTSSSVGE